MPRRLYRSRKERVLGGVCGGLGEYFNIDPALVRVAFALLTLANGLVIIAYVAMWIMFPRQVPQEEPQANSGEGTKASEEEPLFRPGKLRGYWLGIILIVGGILLIVTKLTPILIFPLPILRWLTIFGLWPLLLVVAGVVVLLRWRSR